MDADDILGGPAIEAAVAALAERPRAPLDDNVRIVLAVGGSLLLLRALGV